MKATIALVALLALAALPPGVASAQSSPSITMIAANILKTGLDQGDLLVRWSETGLSPGEVEYVLSADASATYACPTPSAQSFCEVGPATQSRGFSLTAVSGTIRQTASVDEPEPGSACSCEGGSLRLYGVQYSNISITDTDHGVHADLAGPLSLTFCKKDNLKNCPPAS